MTQILDPAQIEVFAERSIPRVRLPDPWVFGHRGARLRALSEGSALREYLLLMAALADAQQAQFDSLRGSLVAERFVEHVGQQIELAQTHRMPVLQAAGWPRQDRWRDVLRALCRAIAGARSGEGDSDGGTDAETVAGTPARSMEPAGHGSSRATSLASDAGAAARGLPDADGVPRAEGVGASASVPGFSFAVFALCERIIGAPDVELDAQADLLIAARTNGVDAPAAPFIMAALQVCWAAMASTLRQTDVAHLDVATVCPVCGFLPVASVVRFDKRGPGHRYLHCGLCESEWHMVRNTS